MKLILRRPFMSEINTIPKKRLWNPKSFIAFSVFFSFLPAGIMCSLNYGRCGYQRKKWICLSSTIVGFIALIALTSMISSKVSSIALPFNVAVGIYLRNIQLKLYEEHIQNGGEKASYLLPIVIGILLLALCIASIIYSSFVPQNSLSYNKNKIYYTDNITKSEAQKLGNCLNSDGFFTTSSESDVKIDKQNDRYIFTMVLGDKYQNDTFLNSDELKKMGEELSKEISQKAFGNSKIQVNFCDNKFKVLKSINSN